MRVVLVDDQTLFRHGLRGVLEDHGIQVVGEAQTGRRGVELTAQVSPDALIVETAIERMDGLDAIRQISTSPNPCPVIVLTTSDDPADVINAVVAGASSYLLKDSNTDEILGALRAVSQGQSMICSPVTGVVINYLRQLAEEQPQPRAANLTQREFEILRLIAEGKENIEIAHELFLSPKTVKNHVAHILGKLELHNRIQAAVFAVRNGLA